MPETDRLDVPPYVRDALADWTGIHDDDALRQVFIVLRRFVQEIGWRPNGTDLALMVEASNRALAARLYPVETRFVWPRPPRKIFRLRAAHGRQPAGATVYEPRGGDWGMATSSKRHTGRDFMSVTLDPAGGYPTLCVEAKDLEEIGETRDPPP